MRRGAGGEFCASRNSIPAFELAGFLFVFFASMRWDAMWFVVLFVVSEGEGGSHLFTKFLAN
jgi:hypothetical protein